MELVSCRSIGPYSCQSVLVGLTEITIASITMISLSREVRHYEDIPVL